MPNILHKDDIYSPFTLKDIDRSLYNIFTRELDLIIDTRQVPILYVGGERWGQLSVVLNDSHATDTAPAEWRDGDNQLLFPLMTLKRMDVNPMPERYVPRYDGYTDIMVGITLATDKRTTDRIDPKYNNQVYELHYISYPIWVVANYEIALYCSFTEDANFIKEQILQRFPVFGNVEHKDYNFWVTLESISNESTTDDLVNDDRIIKYTCQLKVESFIINPNTYKSYRTFDSIILTEYSYTSDKGESFDEFIDRYTGEQSDNNANPLFMKGSVTYASLFDPTMKQISTGGSGGSGGSTTISKYTEIATSTSPTYSFMVNGGDAITDNEHMRLFVNGIFYDKNSDYTITSSMGQVTWNNSDYPIQLGDSIVVFFQPFV